MKRVFSLMLITVSVAWLALSFWIGAGLALAQGPSLQVSLMYLQPSGSGSKYQGRNESLREHQGEATITWGYGSPEMKCTKSPQIKLANTYFLNNE